jgi:phospholipid/cholesterol/gamma-HCH transport system ATP-binding protein
MKMRGAGVPDGTQDTRRRRKGIAVDSLIELEKVCFSSEEFDIIKGITLSIEKNATTIIMGGLGSGKSTLLKIIAGIFPPDQGRALFDGKDFQSIPAAEIVKFRKSSGFVFQDSALWANTSIYKNIALPLEFHFSKMPKKEIEAKVMSLVERVGFHDPVHLRPATLSIGEQKIVSFMRAVVTSPDILFLDDPTQGMDSEFSNKMIEIIRDFKTRKCSIIAVSHDSSFVSLLADNIVILKHGEIAVAGPFDEVKKSRDQYVRSILSNVLGEASSFDTDLLDLLS